MDSTRTSMAELIFATARRMPEAVAVVAGQQLLRFGALARASAALAAELRDRGVGLERPVAFAMPRSQELCVAVLAVLHCGAPFLLIDPAQPDQRLAQLLDDIDPALVLTVAEHAVRCERLARRVLPIDLAALLAAQPPTQGPAAPPPDAAAYIVHTSGSTGRPKGVVLTQCGLLNHNRWHARHFGLAPGDRVLHLSSVGFDALVEELLPTWMVGAAVILASERMLDGAAAFCAEIERLGVSVFDLPTSFWRLLVTEMTAAGARLPACVRLAMVSGERAERDVLAGWRALGGDAIPWANLYGPTETTGISLYYDLPARTAPPDGDPPIGQPIDETSVYLLDDQLSLVADGEPGMLYLGGAGLARGYHRRPDATAAAFVPDPFAAHSGARMYCTGDRARRGPDGMLHFLGRSDAQIKIRGFRIELGEVQRALAELPSVHEVHVTASRRRGDAALELVAHLVAAAAPVAAAELRRQLRSQLPDYMIPARFAWYARLPRNTAGKIDAAALRDGTAASAELHGESATRDGEHDELEPGGEIGRALFAVLGEALDGALPPSWASESFLDLGGHSLAAIRVVARLEERLGVTVPVRMLFEAPSIAAFADALAALPRDGGTAPRRLSRPAELPLSFPQELVWLTQQLQPDSVAYTAPSVIRLCGALDVDALRRSISELVRRHEVLRTTFPATADGQPVQRIEPVAEVELAIGDLRAANAAERRRARTAVLTQPFAMDELPLVRWHLFRLDEAEHELVIVEHHLLHDGWSTNVLMHELWALYAAFARGLPSPLAEPVMQFADYVVWHRRWLDGEVGRAQLRYWTDKLAGAPRELALPLDHPRPPVRSFRGAASRMQISPELDRRLKAWCRSHGVTPYVVLLAVYTVLLHRYSDQADLCIGSGMANRRWRATEGIVGMLINTIVLRADLSGNPTFTALLARLRELVLEAAAHQDLPFERIVETLGVPRDPSRNPLFQVIFGLHDAPLEAVELPGLSWSLLESPPNESAKFDLGVIAIPRPEDEHGWNPALGSDGMTLVWEFDRALFEPETIAAMQQQYAALLDSALADPDRAISRLPLVRAGERAEVARAVGRAGGSYPRGHTIAELVGGHARRDPAARAVSDDGRALSYGELDAASSRLAHRLRRRGVQRGSTVALGLPRSIELVVAMLGVVKAGGAYLPLDVRDPRERLEQLRRAARAEVMLGAGDVALAELAGEPADPPASAATAEDIAYVIYTSGSTGAPKGVAVPHRAIARLVIDSNYLTLGPTDRFGQIGSPAFDISTLEVWAALLSGAEIVILPDAAVLSAGELAAAVERHRITAMIVATSLLDQLVAARPALFARVAQLMFGGAAANPARIRQLLAAGAPGRLIQLYGPTESTVAAAFHVVREVPDDAARVPIGRPISGTYLYVLDRHGEPVPAGVPGELYIGGDGLARGYLHQPALTAERFVPDPFAEHDGARLYATGDRVRYRGDGTLEFLGRLDQQVKIRGVRVEPGEIEAMLACHPAVRAAAVTVHAARGEPELAAYAVLRDEPAAGDRTTAAELRGWLQARLPAALVPASITLLDALPLTSSGKLDRGKLPAPALAAAAERRAPRTATEQTLAQIWSEVLSGSEAGAAPGPAVGIDDNFFEVGGHSLLAMRLLARVSAQLGVELPVATFFATPTIVATATAIVQHRAAAESPARLAELLAEIEQESGQDSGDPEVRP